MCVKAGHGAGRNLSVKNSKVTTFNLAVVTGDDSQRPRTLRKFADPPYRLELEPLLVATEHLISNYLDPFTKDSFNDPVAKQIFVDRIVMAADSSSGRRPKLPVQQLVILGKHTLPLFLRCPSIVCISFCVLHLMAT